MQPQPREPMARKRKAGARTKSGRLKERRYGKPQLRDMGTPEGQAFRLRMVGQDADQTLASLPIGVLHATGVLDRDQYDEALEFRWLYAVCFGSPWPHAAAWWPSGGTEMSDGRFAQCRRRYEYKLRLINEVQRHVLQQVAVDDRMPNDVGRTRLVEALDALLRRKPQQVAVLTEDYALR